MAYPCISQHPPTPIQRRIRPWPDSSIVAVPHWYWLADIVCADAASLAPAKTFIERNLGAPIDVSRIAREVELTRPHFTRVFREAEGMPPWEYVLDRRIRRAEELLAGGVPLSEVADALGFCDQSHFTRVFKRRTGQTPGEYQKRTKVQDDGASAG